MRNAWTDRASIDRSRGVFLSRASPVQLRKAVGMTSVEPFGLSMTYAGLVGSQAVYPRASNVARRPPDGNELASGSPLISSLPENSASAPPVPSGFRKLSCFSAVMPVIGWDRGGEGGAPLSVGPAFMAGGAGAGG